MLINVMDLRERSYRWKSVLAVLESAAKNNEAEDADTIKDDFSVMIDYAERSDISVRDAIQWAERAGVKRIRSGQISERMTHAHCQTRIETLRQRRLNKLALASTGRRAKRPEQMTMPY